MSKPEGALTSLVTSPVWNPFPKVVEFSILPIGLDGTIASSPVEREASVREEHKLVPSRFSAVFMLTNRTKFTKLLSKISPQYPEAYTFIRINQSYIIFVGIRLAVKKCCRATYSESDVWVIFFFLSFCLTQATVAGQLLVDLFHALYVEAACLGMMHHGFGVVYTNYTFGCFLDAFRSIPGFVDILGWETP